MERIILTVKKAGEPTGRDLEVALDIPVGRLVELVNGALGWDMPDTPGSAGYQIEAQPLGRLLGPSETLRSARVQQGGWLVFLSAEEQAAREQARTSAATPVPSTPIRLMDVTAFSGRPVTGRVIPLFADVQPAESPQPAAGFQPVEEPQPFPHSQRRAALEPIDAEENESEGYTWKELDI